MVGWGLTAWSWTNQGSFPFKVFLILHLIVFVFVYATGHIQKSIPPFFSFRRGEGWIRNGEFGVGGKSSELTLG